MYRRRNNRNMSYSKFSKLTRTYNNIVFDSALEMRFYRDRLLPDLNAGKIKDLKLQPKLEIIPGFDYFGETVRGIKYTLDFSFIKDNIIFYIDVKGYPDRSNKIIFKLAKYKLRNTKKVKIAWVGYSKKYGGWRDWFYIDKQKRKEKRKLL